MGGVCMNGSKLEQIQANLKKAREIRKSIAELQEEARLHAIAQTSTESQGLGESNSNSQVKSGGKTLSLNNGHSILGDNNKFNGGFINTLIMALLVGFAGGAITTAVYIFMNLSKVTVSL